MNYEKQWVGLRHKRIKTPFVVSRFLDPVDQTAQETDFPATNYWESIQSQIENLSYIGANDYLWEPESTQLYAGIEQNKGDDPSLNLFYSYESSLSDKYVVVDHEINVTNYWKIYQSQIENLSYVDTNVHLWEPESTQLPAGITRTNEYIHGSFSHNVCMTVQSYVDVVLAHADTGSNYRESYQRPVEILGDVEYDAVIADHESPQLINEAVKVKEYIKGSYLHTTIIDAVSDADVVLNYIETGTAITDFTQLRKHQIEKQELEVSEQFNILSLRQDNWDDRGSLKPTGLTLDHAKKVIDVFLISVISAGYLCNTPSIASDGDGNVTAVWYRDERQLHFQIGEHEAEYIRVWGTNIDTEMDVDYLKSEDCLSHWKWLIDE